MPRLRSIISSFNAGELSPLLDGRVDQEKYFSGAKQLQNFIPTVQGPARRRGGTRHAGVTKNSATARSWFSSFIFSPQQSYVLEWGDLYLRWWTNRGQLLKLGVPYEIVTPYAQADLTTSEGTFALRFESSGDVTWVVHAEGKYPPYRLSRLFATTWTLVPDDLKGGPFEDVNADKTITVQASATTGTGVTITQTAGVDPIFKPGHVGAFFLIEDQNPGLVVPYQSNASVAAGSQYRNAGNVYEALTSFVSTTIPQRYPPVHTEGDANDGVAEYRYLHSGYGWVTITAVAVDGMSCTADVVSQLPDNVVANTTYRWAHGSFSTEFGWPTAVSFFRERLAYNKGRTVYLSGVGDFPNFNRRDAGLVTKETAIKLTLASSEFDSIRWMAEARTLLLGTARNEMSLQEQTTQTVFAADNAQNVPQTKYGGRLIRPLRVGESVLFVERPGHRIRDMQYSFDIDRYKAEDLTVLSEHLFEGSEVAGEPEQEARDVIDWTYQQQRDNIVWCVLSDGGLVALTLNRERGVIAWVPHEIGGNAFVEAVQSIPSPDGKTDDVWFIVRRFVNGAQQRSVEFLLDYRLVKLGLPEAVHVDNSLTYRGAATTTITGLDYLEGEFVQILADGSKQPGQNVVGGQVTLQVAASLVHVGFSFESRYQSMRLETPGGGGTAQAARKGFDEIFLRLQSTVGGYYGCSFDKMDQIKTVSPSAPIGDPPKLFAGDLKVTPPQSGWNTDGYVCYLQRDPYPATLKAVVTPVQVNA